MRYFSLAFFHLGMCPGGSLFFLAMALLFLSTRLNAQESPQMAPSVHIRSDRIDISAKDSTLTAEGMVLFSVKDTQVQAKKITVLLRHQQALAQQDVSIKNEALWVSTNWMGLDWSHPEEPSPDFFDRLGPFVHPWAGQPIELPDRLFQSTVLARGLLLGQKL